MLAVMEDATRAERPPLAIRLLSRLRKTPDWSTVTPEELAAYSSAVNRKVSSPIAKLVGGRPDRGALIRWHDITLPDRRIRVRELRPPVAGGGTGTVLPLVLHVHGGGFQGTAVQSDWANSYLAARLPAVVVSVEHRLLAPGISLQAAFDDGWDILQHLMQHAADWGADPERTAVAGDSTGAAIAALAAIRAKASGTRLRAQVLVNPVLDVTDSMFDHASITRHAASPTLTVPQLRLFQRLAAPPETDPHAVSPLKSDDLEGVAPALVVVPTVDPLADHGRRYAERLRESGTFARLTEHRGAPHGFLAMPGLVRQANAARTEIADFLSEHLTTTQTGNRA
jgi:acetyl esterase